MNFDLNLENYTRSELIEMFELPTNFDRNIIEIKESKLKEKIVNNSQINNDIKVQTINFLTKAKNIILSEDKLVQQEIYNSNYELKSSKLKDSSEHMVQMKPNENYISSYPNEFFTGDLNPIKKRTLVKNLNIDTRFRDNYYSTEPTNFNFNLPLNINNILQMQLTSFELPTSYYVVSKQYNNNYFTIIVNGESAVITIPDGNYSQSTIMDIINTQLTNAGIPFNYVSFIVNLTDGDTGSKQTMVGPNGTGVVGRIELNFQNDRNGIEDHATPLPLKLGWNLGFRNGVYVGNTNYVSEGIVDLTGPRYFYLVIDDYNNNVNNNFYSAFNSSILNKNILARISVQSKDNLNIVTTPRQYFGPVNLNNMNIQLLDEYGRIVDLNNMDFSFCLTLVTVYDL